MSAVLVNTPNFSMEDRLNIVRMRREGLSLDEIRNQKRIALAEEFNRKAAVIREKMQKANEALALLKPFVDEMSDLDFLSAGKKQIEDLKQRVGDFKERQKKVNAILDDGKKEYELSLVLGNRLRVELQSLTNSVRKTPASIPYRGLMIGIGARLSSRAAEGNHS